MQQPLKKVEFFLLEREKELMLSIQLNQEEASPSLPLKSSPLLLRQSQERKKERKKNEMELQ